MGFSNINTWLICFALISMVVVNHVDAAGTPPINEGVLDPCKRPGGPHPGCHPDKNSPPQPVNRYQRGCSKYFRCRGSHG
ncbi:protein RALF-like 11 [Durio zibethinus]|uniref:Protein RALF-like 11 n=1 Tax=Durio zibethinus TaxID=66656 RepID=A0A6P6A4Z1_DURZI|nr:protein RALF-like 11 [Durio zibethinus]